MKTFLYYLISVLSDTGSSPNPDLRMGFGNELETTLLRRIGNFLNKLSQVKTCDNCFHQVNGYCSCRDVSDVVQTPNKCGDWLPKGA